MKKLFALCILSFTFFVLHAQTDKTLKKKGYNFGFLPTITFDSDLGFQYGGLVNVINYGDGTIYPDYRTMTRVEISRYTRGSGVNHFFYDTKVLIPKVRVTVDLGYFTEKALNFYGFNGYQSVYVPGFEDKDNTAEYKSKMFYRMDRKLFRLTTDFSGNLSGTHLKWLAGLGIMNFKTGTVDIAALNKKRKSNDQLPDVPLLYDKYVTWGFIGAGEKNGGNANHIKTGLIYDTRNNEANCTKGIWTEALLGISPKFLFNDRSFTKLILIHRQYFTIVPDRLSFVYRLGYQGTIGTRAPYFFQPYMLNSFSTVTFSDGLGGAKNLRGILRNRVVGDGIAYGNFELRWKFYKFLIGNQNFYAGLNTFVDVGTVTRNIPVDQTLINEAVSDPQNYFNFKYRHDKLHPSIGTGLRIAMNENFILAVDYGFALNKQDGIKGLYISIGNLF